MNNPQLPSDLSVNLEHSLELGINALSVILSKNPVTRPFALILQGLKPLLQALENKINALSDLDQQYLKD
ncbi:hypothetical protein VN0212_13320 [Helicobacter pylori]|nr:hypothetical protein VN0212_13320 [Helicobacter pylori]